jgi:hypothetical protein
MKKILISAGISMLTTLLMAGGNSGTTLAPVANISSASKTCKENKVYIQKEAGLMWQDQAYTDAEDGAVAREHSIAKAGNQRHAVNYCRSLNYGGYSDWRLPTSDELMDVHKPQDNPFVYHRGSDFWTSTPTSENRYYVVYTADAMQYKRKPSESNYIRCVRCLEEGYIFSGSETVK